MWWQANVLFFVCVTTLFFKARNIWMLAIFGHYLSLYHKDNYFQSIWPIPNCVSILAQANFEDRRIFLRPKVTFQVTDLKMSALIILCFFAPWLEKKRASMIWLRTWKNVQGILRSLQITSKNACISIQTAYFYGDSSLNQ